MKKIKIAFVVDTIDYKIGGTERQLILLLKHLDRSRFEPYLCCFKDSKWLKDNSLFFNIYIFPFNSYFSPLDYYNLIKCSKFLKTEGVDIVQTHFRDGNILGIIAAKLAGIKTIISTRRNKGYWHDRKEIAILKILNPVVTSFLANSKAIKSYVHEAEGVSEDKIEVIYNGYESSIFPESSDEQRKQYRQMIGIPSDSPVVVNVANLRPVKGLNVFLKAAQTVISHHSRARFLILGDGPEKETLYRLAENLGITNHVKFLGSRGDVLDILTICDIGVLSSHSEGLSNSIIEYMAAGLPVVCTNVGGNSELVENNKNGFLVSPNNYYEMADAIIKLIDNQTVMRNMGEESLKRAHSTFGSDMFIQRTENYYMNLVSGDRV